MSAPPAWNIGRLKGEGTQEGTCHRLTMHASWNIDLSKLSPINPISHNSSTVARLKAANPPKIMTNWIMVGNSTIPSHGVYGSKCFITPYHSVLLVARLSFLLARLSFLGACVIGRPRSLQCLSNVKLNETKSNYFLGLSRTDSRLDLDPCWIPRFASWLILTVAIF